MAGRTATAGLATPAGAWTAAGRAEAAAAAAATTMGMVAVAAAAGAGRRAGWMAAGAAADQQQQAATRLCLGTGLAAQIGGRTGGAIRTENPTRAVACSGSGQHWLAEKTVWFSLHDLAASEL